LPVLPQEIIRRKRDGKALTRSEIAVFVAGLTDGSFSDAHVASLAMAILLNGMSREEAVALTLAMRDSGTVLTWPELDGPVTDKHSTGGVGDNVSLMLAPIVAACGAFVPMISGRALGHTGGTLDKMDSIPGYRSQPDIGLFRKVVKETGCAIIGQTSDLAPADKRFYAIRDVTGTVESIPLITASILSKKLAAGLDSLVLDVKSGNGAFMASAKEARSLATSLVEVANGAGLACTALITGMDEPLASAAGNAVEVRNAIDFLTGTRDARLEEVTLALAAEMLVSSGIAPSAARGLAAARHALDSGKAAERFQRMVSMLGGPSDLIEKPANYLPRAEVTIPALAPADGFVASIDSRAIGIAVIELGGGRRVPTDRIDHSVGFSRLAPIGTEVAKGDPLGFVHARSQEDAAMGAALLADACRIGPTRPVRRKPVLRRIAAGHS
jgi:thymidine phosphorylase